MTQIQINICLVIDVLIKLVFVFFECKRQRTKDIIENAGKSTRILNFTIRKKTCPTTFFHRWHHFPGIKSQKTAPPPFHPAPLLFPADPLTKTTYLFHFTTRTHRCNVYGRANETQKITHKRNKTRTFRQCWKKPGKYKQIGLTFSKSEAMLQVLGTVPGTVPVCGMGTHAYQLIGKTLVNTLN